MDGAIPNKSSVQFSVVGWGCIPSLLFDLRLNYGGGNEDNGDLLALPHSVSLTLQQATAALYLHRRHSDPQRQVWLSLCGVSWCAQDFSLSSLSISVGYGV